MRDMSDPPPPQPPLPAMPASSLLCSSVVHRSSEPINELDSDDDDVDAVIQVDPPPDAVPTSVTSPAPSSPSALPPPPPPPPPPSKLHIPSRIHHQLCRSTPPTPSTPDSPTPTMEDLDVVRSPLVRQAASFLSTDDPLQPPTKPRLKSTIFVPARSSYFTTGTMPPRRSSPQRYRYSPVCPAPTPRSFSPLDSGWTRVEHPSRAIRHHCIFPGGRASAPLQD